jgi:hypothetical protein
MSITYPQNTRPRGVDISTGVQSKYFIEQNANLLYTVQE